jgi:hypothetical protein
LKYSRFRETAAGDRVRSALRGRACSVTRQILRFGQRQIGNVEPALPYGSNDRILGSNPFRSATDLGSQPLSLVDLAQNTQQTETF